MEKEDRDVGLPFFSQRKYCVFREKRHSKRKENRMKEESLQSEGLGREDSQGGNLRREETQIECLQIEELQRELSVLMQEMLLKHQESDAEVFRIWWEEEGREGRYFSLQRRIEELEEAEWKKRILPYAYEEDVFHEV